MPSPHRLPVLALAALLSSTGCMSWLSHGPTPPPTSTEPPPAQTPPATTPPPTTTPPVGSPPPTSSAYAPWASGHPANDGSARCASSAADNFYWLDEDCGISRFYSCRNADTPTEWKVTNAQGPWSAGPARCVSEFGPSFRFDRPRSAQELSALVTAEDGAFAWINYTRPAGTSEWQSVSPETAGSWRLGTLTNNSGRDVAFSIPLAVGGSLDPAGLTALRTAGILISDVGVLGVDYKGPNTQCGHPTWGAELSFGERTWAFYFDTGTTLDITLNADNTFTFTPGPGGQVVDAGQPATCVTR